MLSLFAQLSEEVRSHSIRVAEYTELLYGWTLEENLYPEDTSLREELRYKVHTLALWHDVGKVMIPKDILEKPGALTDRERKVMKRHVLYARELYKKGHWPAGICDSEQKAALDISCLHHERWDGKGYMCGKSGEDIPVIARICAIADVFDAITSPRPYKKSRSTQEALKEIHEKAGTQFDPLLAELFISRMYVRTMQIKNVKCSVSHDMK